MEALPTDTMWLMAAHLSIMDILELITASKSIYTWALPLVGGISWQSTHVRFTLEGKKCIKVCSVPRLQKYGMCMPYVGSASGYALLTTKIVQGTADGRAVTFKLSHTGGILTPRYINVLDGLARHVAVPFDYPPRFAVDSTPVPCDLPSMLSYIAIDITRPRYTQRVLHNDYNLYCMINKRYKGQLKDYIHSQCIAESLEFLRFMVSFAS